MKKNGSFWKRVRGKIIRKDGTQTEEIRLPEPQDVPETVGSGGPTQPERKGTTIQVNGAVLLLLAALLVIVTVFVTFFVARELYFGGYLSAKSNKVAFNQDTIDPNKVAKFQDILWFIEQNYYLDYDENDLLEGAIQGMMEALGDPYSRYYAPGEMSSYQDYITGTYQGIGVSMKKTDAGYEITEVYEDSPADRLGLEAGDVILQINGQDILGLNGEELSSLLGGAGSTVSLKILFHNGVTDEINLTVETISKQSVFVKEYGNGIYHILITQFDDDTGTEFQHAVNALLSENCKGLVVDLRNNGGGYEREASIVADILLPEGVIATSKNKAGKVLKEIKSDKNYVDLPIVMLINQNTASASELVAGAFRDFEKGRLVGVKSFGKALGQISRSYDKDNSGVVLTVARYFTPSGECIHGVGIAPDEVVELEEAYRNLSPQDIPFENDTQLQRALELLAP